MTTILGIDPGSRITGYGIVRMQGTQAVHVASGTIKVAEHDVPQRLKLIFNALSDLVAEYRPDNVSIEKIFMSKNPDSALKLGQARGVAIVACACADLPVYEYSANEIKKAVVGRGHADKQQVQHMIKMLLALPQALASDEADALAAALCHGNTQFGQLAISQARRVSRGRRA